MNSFLETRIIEAKNKQTIKSDYFTDGIQLGKMPSINKLTTGGCF